jgi:hypothetical protein
MARFNEILVGRFNRALQKVSGIKGAASTPVLASEIVPSFSLFWGSENRYLESWERFGAVNNVTATAANVSCGRLRNPVGSNIVIVVEKLVASELAADILLFRWGQATSDLTTLQALNGNRFDARGRPNPTALMSQQSTSVSAPPLNNQFTWDTQFVAGNTPYQAIFTDIHELAMLPGDALQIETTAVNVGLRVGYIWRERFLEESERS